MTYLLRTLTAIVVTTTMACSNKNEAKNKNSKSHDHTVADQTDIVDERKVVLKDGALNAVYQQYILLTNALTNNDIAEAKIAANAIEAGASEVSGASALSTSASKIMNASEINAQRSAFAQMSKDMELLIRKGGLLIGELYIDFCPMALNDKGASWISNRKEIRNPYFGNEMLGCGEVQDTIK